MSSARKSTRKFRPLFPPFKGIAAEESEVPERSDESREKRFKDDFECPRTCACTPPGYGEYGYDEDYEECDEKSVRSDESESRDEKRQEDLQEEQKLWSLKRCASYVSMGEEEEGEEAEEYSAETEPLLTHSLSVPYEHVPKVRYYSCEEEETYTFKALPKKAPSPDRRLLSETFDLVTAERELKERLEENEIRYYLRRSKEHISRDIEESLRNPVDLDTLVSGLLLRLILEEVILMNSPIRLDIDIHRLMNLLALMAFEEVGSSMLTTSDSNYHQVWRSFFLQRDPDVPGHMRIPQLRSILQRTHTGKSACMEHLHHCLPWNLIYPSHEQGVMKFYPDLSDEMAAKLETDGTRIKSVNVPPDITCFHLREVSDSRRKKRKKRAMKQIKASSCRTDFQHYAISHIVHMRRVQ